MANSILAQIKSAICNNSSHQWGEWLLNDGVCTTIRKCTRCGTIETKNIDHVWGEWNFIENQCVQVRMCAHCGIKEEKGIVHDWGTPFSNEKCKIVKVCRRCSFETETGLLGHAWGEWKYTEKYNCRNGHRVRECEHCHAIQISNDAKHDWQEWEDIHGTCKRESMCLRCGTKRTSEKHSWEEWVFDNKCCHTKKCKVCNKVETRENHDYKLISGVEDVDVWSCREWKCTRCGDVIREGEGRKGWEFPLKHR